MVNDLGDFQTPPGLVSLVLTYLQHQGKIYPRVLEPTCGTGHFLAGLLQLPSPPVEIQALERQPAYVKAAQALALSSDATRVVVQQANLFHTDLSRLLDWRTDGKLLVVGNPPWVTNAALGCLGSDNLPKKENLKHLRGIEARTGGGNFDIAEYIWLKLITELSAEKPAFALLCKTSVARHVLKYGYDHQLPIAHASIIRIDARRWFGASVDACLFCLDVGTEPGHYSATIYPGFQAGVPEATIGIRRGYLVGNVQQYESFADIDGEFPFSWRQGVKHDAASVMELRATSDGQRYNKLGHPVDVEEEYLFPLLKGSDVYRDAFSGRYVVVTQRCPGDDTRTLATTAPRLWEYLTAHADLFGRRKSSIYTGQPPFAMFGIGPYTFSPYKVAISGLHRQPCFRAVGSVNQKPVILDDTCYFIPMSTPLQTAFLTALLNDDVCLTFLALSLFPGSKRPVTKKLLQRLNLSALIDRVEPERVIQRATSLFEHLEGLPHEHEPAFSIGADDPGEFLKRLLLPCQTFPLVLQQSSMSL